MYLQGENKVKKKIVKLFYFLLILERSPGGNVDAHVVVVHGEGDVEEGEGGDE